MTFIKSLALAITAVFALAKTHEHGAEQRCKRSKIL